MLSLATSALCGRAGPVTFLLRQKGNPKRRPQGFAVSLRCSRQAGGAEIARRVARATRDHASGLMLRRLDRLPLRSSGRIHGDPAEPMLDRFAMRITGSRMGVSGLRCRSGKRNRRSTRMRGSWELTGIETPQQFCIFAYAFLDSAEALNKSLVVSNQAKNFLLGNPVLYLTRHAVELFLKGAILTRDEMKRPHHELETLADQYEDLFADDSRFTWNVPFRVQVVGFDAEQVDGVRKEHLRRYPADQLLRYPADRAMKPWNLVSAFDAVLFERQLVSIRTDFERLKPLLFPAA